MPSEHPSPRPFTVLFVCTGNVCRSALAEQLGRAYLDDTLGAEAATVRLLSAGTQAVAGAGMHPDTGLVLRGLGGDPAGFRAQQLHGELAAEADLVLVMTRRHRDAVLGLEPRALTRTFLLREAAGLVGGRDPGEVGSGGAVDQLRAWVAAMAAARGRRATRRADDIPDPIGRSIEVHQEVGEQISGALVPVLARIAELVATEAVGASGA
ncbi:hypothetical protein ABC795_01320 [Blastococcus sp. HT6-30]|uniref:arsenate reductase/protein-tyrosine-phosphatase family protein n=1 Tax=Blastococcus sp. HT6-30 TaxID=3144843 RepID=UPI00321C2EEE